jgi:AcrR family transcriptional regulator
MSAKARQEPWSGDPLPRGRHKLTREAVISSQRARLLRAMAEVVSEDGYEATTIPRVIARARVSTNTFYAHFEDKTACFIALCEQLGEQLFEHLASPEGDPEDQTDALVALNRGIQAYVRWWPDRAAVAHAYFIELPAAAPRAIEERERASIGASRRFSAISPTGPERWTPA